MRGIQLFLWVCVSATLSAQPAGWDKCSPALQERLEISLRSAGEDSLTVILWVEDLSAFEPWARHAGFVVHRKYAPGNLIVLQDRVGRFRDTTLQRQDVRFADIARLHSKEEFSVPGHNLYIDNIAFVQRRFPHLDGTGMTISIKEHRFDTADVDLKNRIVPNSKASSLVRPHASVMATLAAGAGNSSPSGRGVARGARLLSSSFAGLLPDDDEDYNLFGVSTQNHSYGVDMENFYGAEAYAYDLSTQSHPELLHVFSAGNSGLAAAASGVYAGVAGYANLTGNFKMAKNVLTVGAIDSFHTVTAFSSRGPAYDGRIKPDLVAFGQDGASGSAALVSGSALIIQQAFLDQFGTLPGSDMLRAVLVGSAKDTGNPGPDYLSGFGCLDLKKAIRLVQEQWLNTGEAGEGERAGFSIDLPSGIRRLKITLAWNDIPAQPNASKALINDLDLIVEGPSGSTWQPWTLSAFPHPDSLALPARPGRDSLNTIEQVSIDHPAEGRYHIYVQGHAVAGFAQPFAVVAQWEESGRFEWTYPLGGDPAESGRQAVLRWENSFPVDTGILEWKPVAADTWQVIDAGVELSTGFRKWALPGIFAPAQVRMRVAGLEFPSDTFLIAPLVRVQVDVNCPDSVLLSWNSVAPDALYRLWGLGEHYLEPLLQTPDTLVVLQKTEFPQQRFAVSLKSFGSFTQGPAGGAPDVELQGAGCYISNLLALLDDAEAVDITLQIGSLYGMHRIFLEKWRNGVWINFKEAGPSGTSYIFKDEMPDQGANTYRARLAMENGGMLFSDPVAVYYAGKGGYLVFPNPLPIGQSLSVLSRIGAEVPEFRLYDLSGRLVARRAVEDSKMDTKLPLLPQGLYVWEIRSEEGGRLAAGKLAVIP